MKILHLSSHDIFGGAAKAAFRIHHAVGERMESFMGVNSKLSDDYRISYPGSSSQRFLVKLYTQLNYQPARFIAKDKNLMFSNGLLGTSFYSRMIDSIRPDVVNLHWINEGLISVKNIRNIKLPVVWTVHDMWAFTGGCHYTVSCERYKTKCGKCPQLKSGREYDLSTYIFNIKKQLKGKITFVAPSRWMKDCIEQSALFADSMVHHIPYPVDLNVYKPRPKDVVRDLFGLPKDKKLILFGAMNALQDERKGFRNLMGALKLLQDDSELVKNTELVVFGSSRPQDELNKMFKTHYLGKFSDELAISLVYGACDAFVAPSTQDNLPNTVIESLACGVPVVAFNIGGMPDMITSGTNGFLAEPFSGAGLAQGITKALRDTELLGKNARQKAIEDFTPARIAEQYQKVYAGLVH